MVSFVHAADASLLFLTLMTEYTAMLKTQIECSKIYSIFFFALLYTEHTAILGQNTEYR